MLNLLFLIVAVCGLFLLLAMAQRVAELVCVLREMLDELRRLDGVMETRPDTRGHIEVPCPDAPVDAAFKFIAPIRETPVPQLAPQEIAPGLKRPPRPSGGFGTKVRDDDIG